MLGQLFLAELERFEVRVHVVRCLPAMQNKVHDLGKNPVMTHPLLDASRCDLRVVQQVHKSIVSGGSGTDEGESASGRRLNRSALPCCAPGLYAME